MILKMENSSALSITFLSDGTNFFLFLPNMIDAYSIKIYKSIGINTYF